MFFLWVLKMKTADFSDESLVTMTRKLSCSVIYEMLYNYILFDKMLNFFVNCLRFFRFLTSFFIDISSLFKLV